MADLCRQSYSESCHGEQCSGGKRAQVLFHRNRARGSLREFLEKLWISPARTFVLVVRKGRILQVKSMKLVFHHLTFLTYQHRAAFL